MKGQGGAMCFLFLGGVSYGFLYGASLAGSGGGDVR